MRYLTTGILIAFVQLTAAQTTFIVDGFSDEYYGKVQINDTTEILSAGSVAIFSKKQNKEIIRVDSDELATNLHQGKLVANIRSLPYGKQSLIMYGDYNFDNKKDFAICDGQNSCYHGPSFKIYLATKKGFSYSKAFTRLTQEYCGMFEVNSDTKTLHTFTKSGCCMHAFSEFVVEKNIPKAIKVVTEQNEIAYNIITVETRDGKQMRAQTVKTIDVNREGIKVVLSFMIPESGKNVILFNCNDRTLNCAILQADKTVEFSFPVETIYKNPDFSYDTSANNQSLTFSSGKTTYTIYDNLTELKMRVCVDGTCSDILADGSTKIGTLQKLLDVKLDNVVIR